MYWKKYLNLINTKVQGDPSSAAFFSALTLLNKNSSIIIKNVGLNPTRTGFYKILKKIGAKINFTNLKKENNELRGDINVKSCKLKPIKASKEYYVSATDEEALKMFQLCSRLEGIIPALEPSHALAFASTFLPKMAADKIVVLNMCGRGDKDLEAVLPLLDERGLL